MVAAWTLAAIHESCLLLLFSHLFKFSFVGAEMLLTAFVVSHDEMCLSCISLVPSHYNLLSSPKARNVFQN